MVDFTKNPTFLGNMKYIQVGLHKGKRNAEDMKGKVRVGEVQIRKGKGKSKLGKNGEEGQVQNK